MNKYYESALKIKDELVAIRRQLHQNPEVGCNLPNTTKFVMEKLTEYGYEPKEIAPSGVKAIAGGKKPGKVFLIRGDMDALPMEEHSGEEFASTNGCAHACGHDLHTTMMLGAAKLLKEYEDEIEGTIVLMFQPGEEIFKGAQSMLDNGILDDPKVDAALGAHVFNGEGMDVGKVYMLNGPAFASCDGFDITVHGKGSHGALPQMSIDPVNVAAHIHTALQEIIAREVNPGSTCVMTIGELTAGTANNIIPPTARLRGTVRSFSPEDRALMVQRLPEVCEYIAKAFRATAEVKWDYNIPALGCDETLTNEFLGYLKDMPEDVKFSPSWPITGSEDFALVTDRVPGTFLGLGANVEGYVHGQHSPFVRFNEDVIPIGVSSYVTCAIRWLQEHK